MNLGISKMQRNFKWLGRRYFGGVINGIVIGIYIGFFIALQLGWNAKPIIFGIATMIGIPFIGIVGHFVLGKAPEKNIKQ